ncbi:conserved oligomeric Golgi complex subunit 7 [Skeletonema marinoi]|uniref:Conserved oligomeric Golgi complex subunit 7 n=1 Tax=Skeletonema marinoi TaxID=267567 RepID=A0AAD8Y2V1_9STRA|nr:conserved oligomeric Golgi complex subunit 7 [Skeletonema marinoi]
MTSKSPLPRRTSSAMSAYNTTTFDSAHEERLSSLLASSNFSIADYLNLALSSSSDNTNSTNSNQDDDLLEQKMASLALQLQMSTQSCHDEIGRIGAELSAIVPRCAADVTRVKSGLEGMELDVRGLLEGMDDQYHQQQQGSGGKEGGNIHGPDVSGGGSAPKDDDTIITSIDNNTTNPNPLSTLHSLLNLKNHLTTTRSILAAASSWDETINSIPKLLSSSNNNNSGQPNLIEAVAALSKLEQGARALQGMPEGQTERTAAISKLRTQLEVLLKPQLLHALKKMETRLGPLQQCVGMYGTLGKMDVMREEYVRMRPGEVISLWFSFGGHNAAIGKNSVVEDEEEKVMDDEDDLDNDDKTDEEEEAEDFDFSEETTDATTSSSTTNKSSSTQINAKQFIEFLPTFYESVLELLSKERAQSKQVFGPELAPSIVGRVLLECFKPIISSFKSRLGNVCSVPGSGISGNSSSGNDGFGGTEGIAAAYESTIQFLSLAYDQMEPWEGQGCNNQENDHDSASNNDDVMETIRTAFRMIASPFVPYQRALAEAERDPLGKAASMVAKDVRSVVGLQDAADRLGDLAPFMFPLADSAISRFELLTSGYNASATLSLVDNLIATHASELAIAMGSLSGHVSNSKGNEFDEQHANCALEILRIAGSFKRSLKSFDNSVKDRLRSLSDMMLDDTLEQSGGGLPDAIEPAQLRSFLAKEACSLSPDYIDDGTGVKLPASVVELRRLACTTSNSADGTTLFPKSADSVSRLARSCQSFVFEVCYAIPEQNLCGISALPVWKQDGVGSGDEDSYGILPQSFITHVGEHILALVQALEPFASDKEALGLANEVMTRVIEVAVQPWKEFVAAAGVSLTGDEKSQLKSLMRGKEVSQFFGDDGDTDMDNQIEEEDDEEEDPDDKASTAFCNQWLDVVGLAVAGRLLERTMRIPRLGRKGAEHLAADLNYIRNVFTALGVAGHPHPLLGYMAKLVTMDEESLQFKIHSRQGEKTPSDALEVIKRAEIRIAYVRGISVYRYPETCDHST